MKLAGRPSSTLTNMLIVAFMATTGWLSFDHYDQRRQTFQRLCSELEQSQSLARQIDVLRRKPDRAASQSRSEQSLAESIEQSAAAAGVARERIARIEPQQPRRSGDSDYLEHGTVVQLDGVTLAQLATTLVALRSGEGLQQLRVSALRLSAPFQASSAANPEIWNAELTLTYLVYSPKTAAARKS